MKDRYQNKIFKINYISLLSVIYIFGTLVIYKEFSNEKNRINSLQNEYYQRVAGENESKFSVLLTHLNTIKTDDRFITFVGDESTNYYDIATFQKNFRETSSIFANLGYFVGITSTTNNMVISFENTSSKKDFIRKLNLNTSFEDIQEKMKSLKVSELFIKENKENLVLFIKDKELKFGNTFFWIIKLDKKVFFNHFDEEYGQWYFTTKDNSVKVSNKQSSLNSYDSTKLNSVDFLKGKFTLEKYPDNLRLYYWVIIKYLFFILISSIITYHISLKLKDILFKPLKNLLVDMGENINLEEDPLEYIKTTYTNLKKQNMTLTAQVENNKILINKKQIRDYILGIGFEGRKLLDEKTYSLATLEFLENEKLSTVYSKEVALEIKNLLEESLKKELEGSFLEIDHKTVTYLSSGGIENIQKYERIIETLEKNMGISIIVGFIDNLNVDQLPKAYNDSLKLLDYAIIYNKSDVITRKDLDNIKHFSYYYPLKLENQFITRVLNGDIKGSLKIINDLIEENYSTRSLPKGEKQEFLFLLITSFKRISNRLKVKGITINIEPYRLIECRSSKEIEKIIITFMSTINEKVNQEEKGDISNQLMKYIEDNYSEDITLDTLADHIGHSLKYTSFLFKKNIGENFKYTLNKHRIEKAKSIMGKDPQLKIKEISKMVGFNNDSTFIRIFKKYEGISPGKYI